MARSLWMATETSKLPDPRAAGACRSSCVQTTAVAASRNFLMPKSDRSERKKSRRSRRAEAEQAELVAAADEEESANLP